VAGPPEKAKAKGQAKGEAKSEGENEAWDPVTQKKSDKTGTSEVIALDRVRVRAEDIEPITMPVDKARIAVVASGDDAARVRTICHELSLFVPVMANVAIVHETLPMVVMGEPSPPAPERVVHVVRPNIPDDQLRELLHALATGRVPAPPPSRAISAEPPVLSHARRLESARDLSAIEAMAIEAIVELTGSDRAYCLAFEADGSLWSESLRRRSGDDRRAFAGIAGWCARTGLSAHATCAGDDARYLPSIDDPDGKAQTRIAVHPIVTDAKRVRAVLISVRRWRHADYNAGDLRWLATYAELAGPIIERILSRPITIPPPLQPMETVTPPPSPAVPDDDDDVEEMDAEDVHDDDDDDDDDDDEADASPAAARSATDHDHDHDPDDEDATGVVPRVEPPEDTTVESIPAIVAAYLDRTPPSTTQPGILLAHRQPAEDRTGKRRAAEAAVAAARAALEEAEAALRDSDDDEAD
jgi:hypothetical protein